MKNIVKRKTSFKNLDSQIFINSHCVKSVQIGSFFSSVFSCIRTEYRKMQTSKNSVSAHFWCSVVVTVLKLNFPKQKTDIQAFWDYKRLQNDLFRSELYYELSKLDACNLKFEHLFNIFSEVLNKHATMKKKYLRANQGQFLRKELNKELWLDLYFVKSALKRKALTQKIAYKQRKYCVNLLRRTKKNCFANISISSINYNKKFWKSVKPLFSDTRF